ncbi:MAG: hypothetical protein K0Q48_1220 [Bacillota bacterium]|jgi:hypothetical protein|nr:hypothetical protein [Bacillota bacterium]
MGVKQIRCAHGMNQSLPKRLRLHSDAKEAFLLIESGLTGQGLFAIIKG